MHLGEHQVRHKKLLFDCELVSGSSAGPQSGLPFPGFLLKKKEKQGPLPVSPIILRLLKKKRY
jgi:hypothetical protein